MTAILNTAFIVDENSYKADVEDQMIGHVYCAVSALLEFLAKERA